MAALSKSEEAFVIPVTAPISQIPGFPDYFPSVQLPPGTYMAPSISPEPSEEEEELRRKLKNLGIGQVVSGISNAMLGLIVVFVSRWQVSYAVVMGTPWWTGVLSTVAGMLALTVWRRPHRSMGVACLAVNVLCAIACTPAVMMYSLTVRFYPCFGYCSITLRARIISGITIALLLNCLLSLVMSVVIAIMNCRMIHCCDVEAPMTMIVLHADQMPPGANLAPFSAKNGLPALEPPKPIYNVPV